MEIKNKKPEYMVLVYAIRYTNDIPWNYKNRSEKYDLETLDGVWIIEFRKIYEIIKVIENYL